MSKGFFTLVSGSSGNSSLLDSGKTKLLIDCGVNAKSIEAHLIEIETDPSEIDAILVSHEHNDHICGIDVFARRYGTPVYVSSKFSASNTTRFAFMQSEKIERITYTSGSRFRIGDIDIFPFSVPHDVVENCAFRLETKDFNLAYATDIGHLTASLFDYFSLCDYVLIESNYDPDLLKNGPYPYHLKQRIKGSKGHLSNNETRRLIEKLIHPKLKGITLAHLSEMNNTPEKALWEVEDIRAEVHIGVAPRYNPEKWL